MELKKLTKEYVIINDEKYSLMSYLMLPSQKKVFKNSETIKKKFWSNRLLLRIS